MKANNKIDGSSLARLVGRFMGEMHRFDMGRTLRIMQSEKLTTAQAAVLEFVRSPRTVSAVALHLGLSLPATSQMIGKLVRRRLVRRFEGTLDRRERTLVLSAPGGRLLQSIASARHARFEASLSVLPPRVAARLEGALMEAVGALEKS